MCIPGLLCLAIFNYAPIFGLVMAFKDYDYGKGFLGSDWVGLDNFRFFFQSQDMIRITRNTVLFNLTFIVSTITISVLVALLLNEITSRKAVRFYQTTLFFPYFLSFSVVAYIVLALLKYDYGVVNRLLGEWLGMEPVNWYMERKYWPLFLPLINLWKSLGYYVVIFYAGIIGLDTTYYEAAAIDGATRPQMILRITLPLIKPLIILLTLTMIGKIFYSDFGLFYMVPQNSGILYEVTDVIDTYVLRTMQSSSNIGMSTAIGLYQSVVGFVLILGANAAIRKVDQDSAIF